MKTTIASLLSAIATAACAATYTSPDGRLSAEFGADGNIALSYDGRWAVTVELHLKGEAVPAGKRESSWSNDFGERQTVRDAYNLVEAGGVEFRLYDEGLAWRGTRDDGTVFRFGGDWRCWPVSHAQGEYVPYRISSMGRMAPKPAFAPVAAGIGKMFNYEVDVPESAESPLVVEGDGFVAALGDAAVVDFARLRFRKGAVANTVESVLEGPEEGGTLPWRYVRIAESPAALYNGNDILLNLNEPSRIEDTSWIRPGKVLRLAKLDTDAGCQAVDFIKNFALDYLEIDCGWYGEEHIGDPMTPGLAPERVAKGEKFDLFKIMDYAKSKDVPMILYVNREPLKRDKGGIDEILPKLAGWGVKGVKYGFVNVGHHKWARWMARAIEKAAANKIMIDAHDEFRLTGQQRTWPNAMTVEGIRGNEEMPSASHDAALVFTRFLSGPGDYTPCWKIGRVKNSLAHQLALPAAYYSPWQFLFWYSRPSEIDASEPALAFWKEIPTVWAETKALSGEIGEYAVVARRAKNPSGAEKWFVGALNANTPRVIEMKLDFLEGGVYSLRLFSDADSSCTNALGAVKVSRTIVSAGDTVKVPCALNGGFAAIIEKNAESRLAEAVPGVFARAEAQARMLDAVMAEKPQIGDWRHLSPGKGTQGFERDKFERDSAFPRSWTKGEYKVEPPVGWTTGFFPGELWMLYRYTGKPEWKKAAERWTEKLEPIRHFTENHDMGFMFLCSYGLGIKYGGHGEDYASVVRDASKALSTRFRPMPGLIRSWDSPKFMHYPVIIDSMMNLEMLYEYGYKEIAKTHADKVLATQFRPDGSAYHVTDWNPQTGRIYARYAWQGASVDTAWARGQGWAVYGFTMMFRETGDKRYLERAEKCARWILDAAVPADKIPYWDYGAVGVEDGTASRDASAAAVMSSALVELYGFTGKEAYLQRAVEMLSSMAGDGYLSKEGENGGFLLMHSTGSHPEDTEIDASINYADYYFLEALLRFLALERHF